MPEPDQTLKAKLLRRLRWLNWLRLRPESQVVLVLLIITGSVIWYHSFLPVAFQVGIVAFLLLAFAFVLRRGWITFFGPVFTYDVVRSARRSNFAILRSFYAGALLVVLFLVYSSIARTQGNSFWEALWKPATVPAKEVARFSERFFYTYVAVQFFAVLLLTPVCAAGAITEEKERRTLEFVLATDLADREVIVGKLASRMAYLVLFLLTGLPILSFLQLLGGVSPNLVITSFIMTGLTMMSLACLSVAISVFANKTRGAVFLTYLATVGYLLSSSCCCALPVGWLTAGNFGIAVSRLFVSGDVENNLLGVFIEYSTFHVAISTACIIWAALNLRVRGVRQPSGVVIHLPEPDRSGVQRRRLPPPISAEREGALSNDSPKPRRRRVVYPQADAPLKPRPPIGERPILWKELYAEPFFRPGLAGQTLMMVFGVMGLLMGGYVLLLSLAAAISSDSVALFTNGLTRWFGSGLACLMLLGIGVRAAGTITSERDRQTLDSLLTTLLENRSLLYGKWLGSILGVRKGWLVLGPIWGLAVFTGGIDPLALVLLAIGWCTFAAFEAGLGMCFSLLCRSTLVASVSTVLATIALAAGPWALWSLYLTVMYPYTRPANLISIEEFLRYGLIPPVNLGVLSFRSADFESGHYLMLSWEIVRHAVYGVGCYILIAAGLWRMLVTRFPKVTGRMPVGHVPVPPITIADDNN